MTALFMQFQSGRTAFSAFPGSVLQGRRKGLPRVPKAVCRKNRRESGRLRQRLQPKEGSRFSDTGRSVPADSLRMRRTALSREFLPQENLPVFSVGKAGALPSRRKKVTGSSDRGKEYEVYY